MHFLRIAPAFEHIVDIEQFHIAELLGIPREDRDRFRDLIGMEYDQPIQSQGRQMSVLLREKKS